MWDVKEENLEKFRMICRRRLSPEGALGFMIGTIVYVSVMMFFLIGTLVTFGWDYYTTLFEKTIVKIELVLYSLQIIFFNSIFISKKLDLNFKSFKRLLCYYMHFN